MTADEKLDYLIANSDRVEAKVEGLSFEVKTLREDFTELKEEVTEIRDDLNSVKEEVSEIRDDLNSVKEEVSEIREDLNSVKEDVSGLNQRYTILEGEVRSIRNDVTDLRLCVENEIKPSISIIGEQYASINTKLDMLMAQNEKHEQMFIEFHWLRDTVRQLESKVS